MIRFNVKRETPIEMTVTDATLLKGEDGKSAYEIAVEHGFEGTEEEWLESLKQEAQLPVYNSDNEGQFLRIISGVPTWVSVPTAEGDSF